MRSTFLTDLEIEGDPIDLSDDVTVRTAQRADAEALRRLADLEGRAEGAGPHLVAEQDGTVLASLSLVDGTALGDPFRLTVRAIDLLRAHADIARGSETRRGKNRRRVLVGLTSAVAGLTLAATAIAAAPSFRTSGAPVAINPTTKGFTITARCVSVDTDCSGVLDVRTAGKIKPYASSAAAVARVGTFPFTIPAGTKGAVRGRVYGAALAQAMLRGRVVLKLRPAP